MPLGFGVLAAANLTNVYGQAVALIAMTLVDGRRRDLGVAVAGHRHRSRRDVRGLPLAHEHIRDAGRHAGGSGLLLVVLGEPPTRRAGVRVLAMLLVASALAIALYYARFMPTYRTEWARIRGEVAGTTTEAPASSQLYQPGGASIPSRAAAVPRTAAALLHVAVPRARDRRRGWMAGAPPRPVLDRGQRLAARVSGISRAGRAHARRLSPLLCGDACCRHPGRSCRGDDVAEGRGPWRAVAAGLAGLGAGIGVNHWLRIIGTPLF